MKKIILLLAGSLLLTQYAISQNFISEDKQWNVKEDFWGDVHTEIFRIEGDTIINSVSYQKIWLTTDSNMVHWGVVGFIREDSNVVYISEGNGNEGIMYDFNLEIGDTAFISNLICNEMQIVVNDIDTVNYFGVDRKRWSFAWSSEYWIEGIGSNFGPLYSNYYICLFDVQYSLLCFHQNDTLLYIEAGEDDCFQSSVGIEEELNFQQQIIRPNPVPQGQPFTIQSNKIMNDVCIYNAGGVLVEHLSPFPQHTLSIQTDQLKTGLYLIRVRCEADQIFSQKIIIK